MSDELSDQRIVELLEMCEKATLLWKAVCPNECDGDLVGEEHIPECPISHFPKDFGRQFYKSALEALPAALREIQKLRRESQWVRVSPETMPPMDGREVLLRVKSRAGIPGGTLVGHWMPGGHCIEDHPPIDAGWYFFNGYMFDKASEPTEWMPLPAAPSQEPPVEETKR